MRTALLAAVLVGSAVGPVFADPTLGEIVDKLSKPGCPSIKSLEPVFGPQSYTPGNNVTATIATGPLAKLGLTKARATLMFDRYHQHPAEVVDPAIESLRIDVADALIEPAMLAQASVKRHDDVMQVGILYHQHGSNTVTLACRDQPEWARVAWTASSIKDATDKTKLLLDDKGIGLVQVPTDPRTLKLEDDRVVYEREVSNLAVTFKTPIPAAPILTALGLTKVTYKADDVHMSDWTLHDVAGKRLVYKTRWIEIRLEHMPEDLDFSNRAAPIDISKIKIAGIWARPK